MFGSTSQGNAFMYIIFIGTVNEGRNVTLNKVIDNTSSRAFAGSYDDETNTLTITSNVTIWGGVRLIVIK